MFKSMIALKSKLTQARGVFQKATPKRMFSYKQMPPSGSGGAGVGTMFGIGLGTAGLMYLMYHSRNLQLQRMKQGYGTQQMDFFNPVVQERISKTLSYFGGGLLATGVLVGALRNSRLAYANPWLLFFGSIGTMISMQLTSYHDSPVLKHVLWGGFLASTALGMVPLINMASMPIIFDALFATGFTMGGLGLVAYNAPSEQFLAWGGALGMGCAALIGLGFVNMFWPSPALFNLYMYGGLLLFSAFTLYDVQKIIHSAKSKPTWDPINQSIGIYLDAIILFEHFLMIFLNNKKK